jgi:plastocyanin
MRKLLAVAIAVLFVTSMAMAAEHDVDISGFAYNPDTLVVEQGDVVTWTNNDAALHTVTDTSGAFASGDIAGSGGTWSYQFTTIGQFDYTCDYHPSMMGVVIVTPMYTIPSMTTYGLALLALLLIVSTVFVVRRKRAGAVA